MDQLDERYTNLISELEENRKRLYDMLEPISKVRNNIEKIMPTENDYRNKFSLENKMKTIASIIGTELDVRKEIDSSIKNQAELIKKQEDIKKEDESIDNVQILQIAKMMHGEKNGDINI